MTAAVEPTDRAWLDDLKDQNGYGDEQTWREQAVHECKKHTMFVVEEDHGISGDGYEFLDIHPKPESIERRTAAGHIDRSEEFIETWWANGWSHPYAFARMTAALIHSVLGLALSSREVAKSNRVIAQSNIELAVELRLARLERLGLSE